MRRLGGEWEGCEDQMIDYELPCMATGKPKRWVKAMSTISHILFKMRLTRASWFIADLCMDWQVKFR
jgi:hypothetical protein